MKRIADNMGSLNITDLNLNKSFTQLEDTIKTLNTTAHAEVIELENEELEIAKLNATILNFKRDCEYKTWGPWGSCSKTCLHVNETLGTKDRSRSVKWYPRNNGMECIESKKKDSSTCNPGCCHKYINF